jgi:trans-2,3-dihydro-3-hydroxyanthranilate isomerase
MEALPFSGPANRNFPVTGLYYRAPQEDKVNPRYRSVNPSCMGMELDYFIVDVFTATALRGNPLAVVLNTGAVSTERMQAIAREFNLSETTFVERGPIASERTEGVRVRIFTTQEELNFAGHPTLGTASVLRLVAPEAAEGDTIRLNLNVGTVPVRFEGDTLNGEMTQKDPEFGAELDGTEVARLCGLRADDLDPALPPQVVSTGTAFAIVALRSVEALGRLKVNHDEATPWLRERGARWFYVVALTEGQDDCHAQHPAFRSRMQFYGGEDPATGSAAGCAISYLALRGAVASGETVRLRQGVEMGRSSDMRLSARRENSGAVSSLDARITDIRVGGSTVLVAKGRLFLP